MFIEFHLIQNFAPSNLNRDDTNNPKDGNSVHISETGAVWGSGCLSFVIETRFKRKKIAKRSI